MGPSRSPAMPIPRPLDPSTRLLRGPAPSDVEVAAMRRPVPDAIPRVLLDEVTALLRARRLANARNRRGALAELGRLAVNDEREAEAGHARVRRPERPGERW